MTLQLQGMTDETYSEILDQVEDIRFLIVNAGGMATKTRVEEVLMARYKCERGDAHTFVNLSETANKRDFMVGKAGGVTWQAKRPEPKFEDWPELKRS